MATHDLLRMDGLSRPGDAQGGDRKKRRPELIAWSYRWTRVQLLTRQDDSTQGRHYKMVSPSVLSQKYAYILGVSEDGVCCGSPCEWTAIAL